MVPARADGGFTGVALELQTVLVELRGSIPTGGWEAKDAQSFALDMADAARLLTKLDSFVDRVSEAAVRVITMAKARAETRAKLAERRALEQFSILAVGIREIVWDLLDDEGRAVFESRVRRELFVANRIEPPSELGGRGSSAKDNLN